MEERKPSSRTKRYETFHHKNKEKERNSWQIRSLQRTGQSKSSGRCFVQTNQEETTINDRLARNSLINNQIMWKSTHEFCSFFLFLSLARIEGNIRERRSRLTDPSERPSNNGQFCSIAGRQHACCPPPKPTLHHLKLNFFFSVEFFSY